MMVTMPFDRARRESRWTGKSWAVRFVMWVKWKTFVRGVMAFCEHVVKKVLRRRHGKLEAGHDDALAPHPLVPRRQHAGIVLLGRDDLVAGLEVDPVLDDLEGFAGAAGQGHLLGVGAELHGHPPADGLDVLGDLGLIVDGQHVDDVHVAPDGLQATRGVGQVKPLFRLMSVRSSLKASWISRQKNSSLATASGVMPATDCDGVRDALERLRP